MPYRIASTELANMTPETRNKAMTDLIQAAKNDGASTRAALEARVHQFELRYELTSEEMLQALSGGEMTETAEIAEWLFLLGAMSDNGRG